MPSPIAHLAAGYVVYRIARHYEPQPRMQSFKNIPGLLILAGCFSLLPDIDSVVGLLLGDFGRYHNNFSHSLLVGIAIAMAFGAFMQWRASSFAFWFLFSLVCYSLHIFMDAATWSRGVMAFWPVSDQRYLAPVTFFYGLHWSNGLWSIRHLWTVITELIFAAALVVPWWHRARPKEVTE
jgi:membrane-bound metal-dependent hydrolase YbcI (DUF457 family)